MNALRDPLRDVLERGGFGRAGGLLALDAAELAKAIADPTASAYEQLDAALALALRGDARAIPTLRRVFDEQFFALTNSLHEYGYAALGLALLGDRDSIERIRRGPRINLSGPYCDLALRHLAPTD